MDKILNIDSWSPYPKGPIPTYRIDLSLPPSQRYHVLCTDFGARMRDLVPLFDRILCAIIPFRYPRLFVKYVLSKCLRGVYSVEETEEIRGIAEGSGVELYVVVALNVLLDSLLGCTSGGVRVRGKKGAKGEKKVGMMHFRTLDWGMDGLRSLLVVLEFVNSNSDEPEKVIAKSITYAGFVGVLTGVRTDLSISLNFRPTHSCSALSLRTHQLLVLLGYRSSISSHLRATLLPDTSSLPPLSHSITKLANITSSPCYLILSSSQQTTVLERDLHHSTTRSSSSFIVHTNHDQSLPSRSSPTPVDIDMWIEDSEYRQSCIADKWASVVLKHANKQCNDEEEASIVEETLFNWVKAYPIMNESSHFGCVMDPRSGTIRMLEREGTKKRRPNVVLTMN